MEEPQLPECPEELLAKEVKKENILYKCGWSPFEGTKFSNAVQSTFINGKRVYHLGRFSKVSPKMRLKFKR